MLCKGRTKGPLLRHAVNTYMDTSLSASGVFVFIGNQDKTAYIYSACCGEHVFYALALMRTAPLLRYHPYGIQVPRIHSAFTRAGLTCYHINVIPRAVRRGDRTLFIAKLFFFLILLPCSGWLVMRFLGQHRPDNARQFIRDGYRGSLFATAQHQSFGPQGESVV